MKLVGIDQNLVFLRWHFLLERKPDCSGEKGWLTRVPIPRKVLDLFYFKVFTLAEFDVCGNL